MVLQEKLRLALSAATNGNQQAAAAMQAAVTAAEQQHAAAEAQVLKLQQELEQEREQKTELIQQNAELRQQLEDAQAPGPKPATPGPQPPMPPPDDWPPNPDTGSEDSTDSDGPEPPEGLAADNFGVLPPSMTGGKNKWTQFKHQSRQMAASLYRLLHNHKSDRPLQMNKLWVLQGEAPVGSADQHSNNVLWAQAGWQQPASTFFAFMLAP